MNQQEHQKKVIELKIDMINMLAKAGQGHIGGPMGMADMMVYLYHNYLKVDPKNPNWVQRDYMLVSNGHTCPIWYVVLADLGFFSKSELANLRQINSLLQGHPKVGIPGVENSSGPLGHGLSQAVGISLGLKMDNKPNKVVCFLSDGEHQEGQTWEAIMSAGNWKLNNLIAVIDNNNIQIDSHTSDMMNIESLTEKYDAFHWHTIRIDGHNYEQIKQALESANSLDKPTVIICDNIPGKGVSFMENKFEYHDWTGTDGDLEKSIAELTEQLNNLS
jgi:transketolase